MFSLKPTLHVPAALCDVTILISETLVLLWRPDVFVIAQSAGWLRLALELQQQVSCHSSRRMDVFVSSTNTKHTPSDPHPTHHLCFLIPRGLWTSRCLAIHFTARSNFLRALAVNQKINGTFFFPRGFQRQINRGRSIVIRMRQPWNEAEQMLWTSVIRFSSKGNGRLSRPGRGFVFFSFFCHWAAVMGSPPLLSYCLDAASGPLCSCV